MVEKILIKVSFISILLKRTIHYMHLLNQFFIMLFHLICILTLENLFKNYYKNIYLLYHLLKRFILLVLFRKYKFFDYSFTLFNTYNLLMITIQQE